MQTIDPGHTYHLRCLDNPAGPDVQPLVFVKREGPGYPGNVGHHGGTTTQEVLRALIERTQYVDQQIADPNNGEVVWALRYAIWQLEERAARRHGREWKVPLHEIELLPTCDKCNHIGCSGSCH